MNVLPMRVDNARFGFFHIGVLAISSALMSAGPTSATFMVLSGNNPGPNQENVQFDVDAVGTMVQGITNQLASAVDFTSSSQFLATPSSGQARVEAREGNDINSNQIAIDDSITVSLPNAGVSFGDLIFNAFIGGGLGSGGSLTIVVSGVDSNNLPVSTTFTQDSDGDPLMLGNGQNFFTVLASDGQRITSVEISPDANSSYADLRQIRISNVIPEPASCLIGGLGLLIFVAKRRR